MAAGPYDAVVVGAGPAGSAAAAGLARAGRTVLLLEKDRFPRAKVCGEFLPGGVLESLDRLGVARAVLESAERIEAGAVHPAFGVPAVAFRLPAGGYGLSRRVLDPLLASRAAALGAESVFGARVTAVSGGPGAFRVRFRTGAEEHEIEARTAVGAWGRWDALDRTMRRSLPGARGRFSAWSLDFAPDPSLAGSVHLYVFPGGYCGLSRVEGGRVHLAGLVSERVRQSTPDGWPGILAHARRANPDLDHALATLRASDEGFHGAGPVAFAAKPPVENGMLMAGDAAGVVDPFSGEGQSTALASGLLAADVIERGLSGEIALARVPDAYARAWRGRFRKRFAWSAAFRRLMLSPTVGGWAARVAGPGMARLAVARLATSPSRPPA